MKVERLIALVAANAFLCLPIFAATCESLAKLSLANTTITAADSVTSGTFLADGTNPIHDLPAFCRVAATLTPAPDSRIRIEVWMPAAGWNGKYEGTGNGGYAGGVGYGALADALRRGYAVANTDMGTAHWSDDNENALVGHPDRWADWGWRSTHEMTVAAKQLIRAYYSREPQHSYFVGCSTGGEQAMMEAQRFPDDYDGIVAGAPANNRTRLHMEILWNFVSGARRPADRIPAGKLPFITKAVFDACPGARAVAADSFLSAPDDCHWDPEALLCKAGDGPDCLTAEQVITARNLYGGPKNPVTQESIYPGLPRGSEFSWPAAMPENVPPPYDALFKWTFGAAWNWQTFDFNRDVKTVDDRLATMLNATNPDLSVFKAHGHKLISYHGWADWLVPPDESILYYRSVLETQSAAAASHNRSTEEETQSFFRLFMVPGMAHCSGGSGLNSLEPLAPLELWVEKGTAPQKIDSWRAEGSATVMTRPLCPYPQAAHYSGTGDAKDAANFSCADPGPKSSH
jgi:feruloyl esterase